MDQFSFFFAFYGLILGLAVTELLGGFAGIVRERALRRIEPQTAMLAILVFVCISVTWLDAWSALRAITLDFSGLWAPVLAAMFYFLAGSVVFPSDPADFGHLATYFAERKRFVVGMLILAEVLVTYTFRHVMAETMARDPAAFWLWWLPYNLAVKGSWIALFFVRGRRANIALCTVLILLFLIPYWEQGVMADVTARRWG